MANSPQAIKRAKQAEKRRQLSASQRSTMRTGVKSVVRAIEAGDKEKAVAAYRDAVPVLDKMVTKGIVHKNTAARHKSRLNTRIRAL